MSCPGPGDWLGERQVTPVTVVSLNCETSSGNVGNELLSFFSEAVKEQA